MNKSLEGKYAAYPSTSMAYPLNPEQKG